VEPTAIAEEAANEGEDYRQKHGYDQPNQKEGIINPKGGKDRLNKIEFSVV
jgi:hypothetical protein